MPPLPVAFTIIEPFSVVQLVTLFAVRLVVIIASRTVTVTCAVPVQPFAAVAVTV